MIGKVREFGEVSRRERDSRLGPSVAERSALLRGQHPTRRGNTRADAPFRGPVGGFAHEDLRLASVRAFVSSSTVHDQEKFDRPQLWILLVSLDVVVVRDRFMTWAVLRQILRLPRHCAGALDDWPRAHGAHAAGDEKRSSHRA